MSPALTLPWPAATMVPTTLRTIWWQNAVPLISKRKIPSPRSSQPALRIRRTGEGGSWSASTLGRRQNAEKSCSPRKGSLASSRRSSDSGCGTCHERCALKGSGTSRSEEHTSELQSLMRISYAVFCLKKKNNHRHNNELDSHDIGVISETDTI